MKVNKKYLRFFVPAILIVVIAIATFLQVRPKEYRFTGTITKEDINCPLADDEDVIYVDDKKVVTNSNPPTAIENILKTGENHGYFDYDSCNHFDIYSIKRGRMGFPIPGQPNGGEELIGRKVEVFAAQNSDKSFTLQGRKDYYVRLAK